MKLVLSFEERRWYRGLELNQAKKAKRPPFEDTRYSLFVVDGKGHIVFPRGLDDFVLEYLADKGIACSVRDVSPPVDPRKFTPDWEALGRFNIELDPAQRELVDLVLANHNGRYNCPTGFGKTLCAAALSVLLPWSKIVITTYSADVLETRIYPEMKSYLPLTGIITGKRFKPADRVIVCSVGSLHRLPWQPDLVIGDECHEFATGDRAARFAQFEYARMAGLSASHALRGEHGERGVDMRVRAFFGPIRQMVHYQDTVATGRIVNLQVIWRDVRSDVDPAAGVTNDVERKRRCYWRNEQRNAAIAADARLYDRDTQVLIVVETLEHALALKELLPEFFLVYSHGTTADDVKSMSAKGLEVGELPPMTLARRLKLASYFEQGKIKKVIATPVWNRGVSFNRLAVLIRGDGADSREKDVQIPGRASRSADGKEIGIIHDYRDQFNDSTLRKARSREKMYREMGWINILPDAASTESPSRSTSRGAPISHRKGRPTDV